MKQMLCIPVIFLFLAAPAFGDGEEIQKMEIGATEIKPSTAAFSEQKSHDGQKMSILDRKLPSVPSEDDELLRLAEELDTLKSKSVMEKAVLLNTQTPRKVKISGMKTVYSYRENAIYEALSAPDHVTDIQLQPGEMLTSPPTSGDTVRWNISPMKSGITPNEITHLILKPLEEDIETNLIITTDKHIYHLRLKSCDIHMPAISWNYPQEETRKMQAVLKKQDLEEETLSPSKLRFDYEIDGNHYSWRPIRAFDDGAKTYIQMPKEMRTSDAPALFVLDDSAEPMLVNYRVKGDYYILDRLFEEAELRVGTHQHVIIHQRISHPNFFQRLFN